MTEIVKEQELEMIGQGTDGSKYTPLQGAYLAFLLLVLTLFH